MEKEVLLFADWDKYTGMGHLSRCFSIAQALNKKGVRSKIITKESIPADFTSLQNVENATGNWYEVKFLPKVIKKDTVSIVDSYLAKPETYFYLYRNSKLLVSIDDNKRIKYPGGILINSNIYAKHLRYEQNKKISLLLGPSYTPLKKPFWLRKRKIIKRKVNSILITTGGSDNKNFLPHIIRLLSERFPGVTKNVLVIRNFYNLTETKKHSDQQTNLFQDAPADKIRELMYNSDLAISGGGQTIYELANTGLPAIVIQLSDDQRRNIQYWRMSGFIEYIGKITDSKTVNKIDSAIIKLGSQHLRHLRSQIGRKLVDGLGAKRITNTIYERIN